MHSWLPDHKLSKADRAFLGVLKVKDELNALMIDIEHLRGENRDKSQNKKYIDGISKVETALADWQGGPLHEFVKVLDSAWA